MNTSITNDTTTLCNLNSDHAVSSSIFFACELTNIILGLPTNSYVLWLIISGGDGLVASDFSALNLSVSEILYCLLTISGLVLEKVSFGGVSQHIHLLSVGLILAGRPLFQCCICIERYLAVVHPVTFLKYRPLRYRVACSGLAWLTVLGFSLTFMVIEKPQYYYCAFVLYLFFLCVKLFCSMSVLMVLKRPGPGEVDREREGTNNMKMRAFRIILLILVSMLINYLPTLVVVPISVFLGHTQSYTAFAVSFSFTVVTGLVQPLLYLHRAGKLPCIRGL